MESKSFEYQNKYHKDEMKNKRVVIFVDYAQKYSSFIVKKHNKSMVDELVDFRIYFLLIKFDIQTILVKISSAVCW